MKDKDKISNDRVKKFSVSKTVNMIEDANINNVERAYLKAWKMGLMDTTVYRHGSKSGQAIQPGSGEESTRYNHYVHCDPEQYSV